MDKKNGNSNGKIERPDYQNITLGYDQSYYSLFEQATDAILVTDFQGNFRDVNTSFCNLFGYTKEELLRINVKMLLDEKQLQEKPIRFDLLAIGENIFNERKMVHKNGTIVYVEANSKRFNDNHILVIARDITARKKSEEILLKSEANLHTIFDTTDTIYVLLDNDLRIISYNPRAYNFAKNELGHTMEISEYFLDYFPREKKPVLQAYMNEVLTGKPINYEINYPQRDDSFNRYHVRMFPISKGGQNIYGLVIAVSDVTEKKLLEQRLLDLKVQEQKNITKAIADAQEKERADLGRELHDNVLQLLTTSSMFASHSLAHPENNTEFIIKTKEHISTAIETLRKLSHALVGPTQDASMGLIESLEELTFNISVVRDIKVIFNHSTFKDEDYEVALKLVIYRIIQEQVNNILKHSAASAIKIELIREPDGLVVIIEDNGQGFDPLVKTNGIGFKNIRNRAEIYNGAVTIEASPGNGCKLQITFRFNNI